MANSAKRMALTSAAAAVAVFFGLNAASAFTITILGGFDGGPATPAPFTLMTIPGVGTNTFISSAPFVSGSPGFDAAVSFAGGTPPSGVYAGNGVGFQSPFNNATSPYLVAGGINGAVSVAYTHTQNFLDLLWGSIDPQPGRNVVTITVAGATITGADIDAAIAASAFAGSTNAYIAITGLSNFNSVAFTDSGATGFPSFEFVPGVGAVPEPSTWAMMLLGFVGLGFAFRQSRRKVSMA
jgi:hypothetical protein